jgi:hypothetical protein
MEHLSQPPPLKIDSPNLAVEWQTWLEDWELYAVGSGLEEKPPATQRAVFLHCIGPEARNKYKGFNLSDDDRKDLAKIRDAFAAYCKPVLNDVIERHQFWHMRPGVNEPIDAFVAALRSKAKTCNFGEQSDYMIRDRIVYTCTDKRTKEALVRADKLDLKAAIQICRSAESAREGLRELTPAPSLEPMESSSQLFGTPASVATVSRSPSAIRQGRQYNRSAQSACGNCGTQHDPRRCPAYGKTCNYCHKVGHFAQLCRQRSYSKGQFSSKQRHTATGK